MEKVKDKKVLSSYREVPGCKLANIPMSRDFCMELCPFSEGCTVKEKINFLEKS